MYKLLVSIPKRLNFCLILCCFWTFSVNAGAEESVDPWEGLNRSIYKFNDIADRYLLKPVAKVYQKVTPQFIDSSISRFFDNLAEPASALNSLLQAKPLDSSKTIGRFLVNTTVGLVGFIDIATRWGIEQRPEDFGQTLAVWGVESGPYLMLPFYGPSTIRDTSGKVVDVYSDPVTYVDDVSTRNSIKAVDVIDTRADFLSAEELISGDRYVFIRDAYLQRRDFLIKDGVVEDSFGDFEDEE